MLSKEHRLRSRRDFEKVYKQGAGFLHRLAVLRILSRDTSMPARFGFAVSPKIGTVVARNRAKRRLREVVRKFLPEVRESGYDAVIIGRPAMRDASFTELAEAVGELFIKAGILPRSNSRPAES